MKSVENMCVPLLRFHEFRQDWENRRLKDLSILITKGTTPKSYSSMGVNYVKIENIVGTKINVSNCLFINKEIHFGELRRSILQKNDILFAIAGATVGKVAIVKDEILPANTNQALAIIRLEDVQKLMFILFILQSGIMKKYIYQNIAIGAQPNLNLEQIGDFTFYTPINPEQQKIAAFLSVVDRKIQLLTRKKELLDDYKKGVMQKIFSQEFRFKDENGKDYPDWEERRLGEITKLFSIRNKNLIKAPIYSVTNYDGFVLQSKHFDREVAGEDLKAYKVIRQNSFAYNPARINVGSIGFFSGEVGIISSLYVCFKTTEELDDTFLWQTLQLEKSKHYIRTYGEGGVRIYLWYPLFASIKVSIPTLKEQKKIALFLRHIEDRINTVKTQIKFSQQFKKGLLQQMFV